MAADLDDCSVMEQSSSSSSPFPLSPSNQPELWNRMEEATREIIEQVHPTLVSEGRRRDVILYMQRFIKTRLGCEVHSFGSVPLKTYLPDGDIDLTAFGGPWSDEELAHKVFNVLKREKQNVDAEFIIKDVQLIPAEVKLVTCLVQNLVVDISFNQLGGICTLSFLEKIDQLVGKDHLFKRSIILIKAWCYYESHILGAVHGLISTYALETLVLYIFHLFHSSLNGPLAVLYKFLDYFSKFDWDKYCISLYGPICLSSLPDFVVETPENGGQDLLLTNEFLNECLEMYTVPPRGFETTNQRVFTSKYLNVVDPLKENNNLGRSVNKANFYRVRTAFTYGARKLGQIILQSEEEISFELRKFFSNMLHRHGRGHAVPAVRYNDISPPNHVQDSSSSSGAARHGQEHLLCAEANVSSSTAPSVSEEQRLDDALDKENVSPLNVGTPNILSDLTGDYDSQLNSLRFGRWWLDYVQNGLFTQLHENNNNSWEVFPQALPISWNDPGLVNPNAFQMNPHMFPDGNFVLEDLPKPPRTGTYLPNANTYRDEPFSSRRNSRRYNGRRIPSEMDFLDRNNHHYPNQTNGSYFSDMSILRSFSGTTNGPINHPYEPLPAEVRYPPEGSKLSDITTSIPSSSSSSKQAYRVTARKTYHLTDEKEFPPL